MKNIQKDWKNISVLVNPKGREDAILGFLLERSSEFERKDVAEPKDIYTISVPKRFVFKALQENLHVDFGGDPKRVVVFGSEDALRGFLDKHKMKDTAIERLDGETVVACKCERLSPRDEVLAMKAGLLVGRIDYRP